MFLGIPLLLQYGKKQSHQICWGMGKQGGLELNRIWLQLEGLFLLIVVAVIYFTYLHGSLVLFLLLFFVPDVGMLGYVRSIRAGAKIYNLFHTTVFPLSLLLIGWFARNEWCLQMALIWLAHIGMDRALGFGLKYSTTFKDTHLQRL
jgi:hypothetical protein